MRPEILYYSSFLLYWPNEQVVEHMTEGTVAQIMAQAGDSDIPDIAVGDAKFGLSFLQASHLLAS